jgi:thiol-disulfide isomerase/thioredoxin
MVATNPKHFKSEVLSAKDQLVVVDFISPSCYACKTMFSKVKQLADNNPEVKFIMVNVDDMPELANGMQVKVLPFFQLWRNSEMLAGLTANLKTLDVLRAELSSHKDCTVPQCESN